MEEKKKNYYIVAPIIFLVLMGIIVAGLLFYAPMKLKRITKQLRDRYGIEFIAENARGVRGNDFIVKSLEGVSVYGSTDLFGNVKSESYVNYYYADDCKYDIENKIGDYFDDCIIVVDQINDYSYLYGEKFPFKSINSYEEYLEATKEKNSMRYHVKVRVYLRNKEDLKHVSEAKEYLENENEYIWVYYYVVPDEFYDALKKSGIYCFNFSDSMDEFESAHENDYKYIFGNEGEVID